MLKVTNLHAGVEGKTILRGVSLTVKPGEIHAVMGPNGSGKSTLAYSIMGHPSYEVLQQKAKSSITLDGTELLGLSTDERARLGLFLAFQSPVSIPGVSVGKFLRNLLKLKNTNFKKEEKAAPWAASIKDAVALNRQLDVLTKKLKIAPDLLSRFLNDNFSGGEKKKIEALQMLVLKPNYALIDEIDTGLDVDALKIVAQAITEVVSNKCGVLIITHYQRLLHYVKPDFIHVLINGKIVKSGTAALALEIEKNGYKTFA